MNITEMVWPSFSQISPVQVGEIQAYCLNEYGPFLKSKIINAIVIGVLVLSTVLFYVSYYRTKRALQEEKNGGVVKP